MTPAEQLRAAKALIDTPEKTAKNAYARNQLGIGVWYDADDACSFCIVGALGRVGCNISNAMNPTLQALRAALGKPLGDHVIAKFNDDPATTHADIMKLFDDAIALAEAAQ